jgi:hypothetical protein
MDNVQSIDIGYDRTHLVLVWPGFEVGPFAHGDALRRSMPDIAERLRRLPGVEAVALSSVGPMDGVSFSGLFLPGRDSLPHIGEFSSPPSNVVSPGFFHAAGIRIVEGRAFTEADGPAAPRVVVVSRAMAQAFWPGQTAIGQCLILDQRTNPCSTVIGVADNAHVSQLIESTQLLYFRPLAQAKAAPGVIEWPRCSPVGCCTRSCSA